MYFGHLRRVLSDQLACWEGPFLEAVVGLDVLDIRVVYVAPEEVEIFHPCVLLNYDGSSHLRFILSLKVWLITLQLGHLLNHSDEESACILVVWHHTEAAWQLRQNLSVVVVAEHRLSKVRSMLLRDIRHRFKAIEVGQLGVSPFLLSLLINFFALFPAFHLHEGPAGHTLLKAEPFEHVLCLEQSDLTLELLQSRSHYRLVLNRVERARRVSDLSTNLEQLDTSFKDLNLESMERLAVPRTPIFPLGRNLANGRVRAARHIADDAIVTHSPVLARLAVFEAELGEDLSLVISDGYIGLIKTVHLMSEHEGAFIIGVVRNDEA